MGEPNTLLQIGNYYLVAQSDGTSRFAELTEIRKQGDSAVDEYYVRYEGRERRLGEWVLLDKIDLSSRRPPDDSLHSCLDGSENGSGDFERRKMTRNQNHKHGEVNSHDSQTAAETIRDFDIELLSPTAWYHRERFLLREFYREKQTPFAETVVEEYADQLYAEKKKRVEYEKDLQLVWKAVAQMLKAEAGGFDIGITKVLRDFFHRHSDSELVLDAYKDFKKSMEEIRNADAKPSYEELSELYALLKQFMVGDNNTGVTKKDAMQQCLQAAKILIERFGLD